MSSRRSSSLTLGAMPPLRKKTSRMRAPCWKLISAAEVARRVRCYERTIRCAVDEGTLRAGRVRATRRRSRGATRIRPVHLDEWLSAEDDEEG